MAGTQSFDITTGCDLQEVDNAVNQANKELGQRYDFRGVKFELVLDKAKNQITISAPDSHKLEAIWDVLHAKLHKRNVPTRNLQRGAAQDAAGGTQRQVVTLQQGISTETAKKIVKWIKDQKFKKAQGSIQAEQVRVTSPSRDELQEVMAGLRAQDFGVELKFGNYRG